MVVEVRFVGVEERVVRRVVFIGVGVCGHRVSADVGVWWEGLCHVVVIVYVCGHEFLVCWYGVGCGVVLYQIRLYVVGGI